MHRFRAKRGQRIRVAECLTKRHGQNLAVTVFHAPYSLDSGARQAAGQDFRTLLAFFIASHDPLRKPTPLKLATLESKVDIGDPGYYTCGKIKPKLNHAKSSG